MTLNDLENTMVVQMRNQQLYLVITDCLPPNASENKDIVFLSQGGYMQGTSYTFNMLMNTDNDFVSEQDEYSSKEVELKLNAPNQTESRTY